MTQSGSDSGLSGGSQSGVSPVVGGGAYCTACGAPHGAGQGYCGRCGNRLVAEVPADDPSGGAELGPSGTTFDPAAAALPDPQPAGPVADDPPYSTGATVGAVLLSLVMPFIALIAALVIRSQEHGPKRRQFLKNWAIGSGVWLCTGWLIPLIALGSVGSAVSGCQGGIDQSVPPSYQSNDGVHWQATYACMNGGTETKPAPASQVPGG
jgi:hypothetical protein